MADDTYTPRSYACSFCGKKQEDVRKIIAGPTVFICDECVDICKDIVDYGSDRAPSPAEFNRVLGYLTRIFGEPVRAGGERPLSYEEIQLDLKELKARVAADVAEMPEALARFDAFIRNYNAKGDGKR